MRKNPPGSMAFTFYLFLSLMTGLAIATPPAIAANLLPDINAGALFLIGAVVILLLTMVVEVWRETGTKRKPQDKPAEF
ncbi:MAG TPA: hypothetical protein ENJ90_03055 [Devosia sp.]|nr:hypothetical protein [Devosia sp.]